MDSVVRRSCFHCGEPVPQGDHFPVLVNGEEQATCCAGCQAVANLILERGMDRYYQFRESLSRRAGDDRVRLEAAWRSVDDDRRLWGPESRPGEHELIIQTEGIVCAACAWLIRSHLAVRPGINECHVDVSGGLVRLLWDPDQVRLSDIAKGLLDLGYKPHLPLPETEARARRDERADSLKRVGVAGLGMMQVMMYAVALYAGEAQGISLAAQRFLEWVSLLVTTPVLLYSGQVFFRNAWQSLRRGRAGMDVPVSLALAGAFSVSLVNFFRATGPVWFDSVVMFIFFLSLARHVEMSLRHRNQASGAMLARLLPEWAERITPQGTETVAISELEAGDRVRVRAGESFPADGVLNSAGAEINEALLTGESRPVLKRAGERVIGGSINLGQAVEVELDAVGPDSILSNLSRMIRGARASRQSEPDATERYAAWFVGGVLILTAVTAVAWTMIDPSRAFGISLSVLVVSCPCAFSLASPSVKSAASRALLRHGVILARAEALEVLSSTKLALFDKTGTLTTGAPGIGEVHVNPNSPAQDVQAMLRIAATLEQFSNHPVAAAFAEYQPIAGPEEVNVVAGRGISGLVQGTHYRLGTWEFAGNGGEEPAEESRPEYVQGHVWLSDHTGWLLCVGLTDTTRHGARQLVGYLQDQGIHCAILSGDQQDPVGAVARKLDIADWAHGLSAQQKIGRLEILRGKHGAACMIGDGVNDAPVLAAADTSIAVQGGTELANSASDFILTGFSLEGVRIAHQIARQAGRTVRQNMAWAAAYNLSMIPLSAFGFLQPWMAALGMSLSSLFVVINAGRVSGVSKTSEKPMESTI